MNARLGLEAFYLSIRDVILRQLRDRSRPVWHRLLRVALLCHDLDRISDASLLQNLLAHHESAAPEVLPLASEDADVVAQRVSSRLELAITLSNERCQAPDCGQRFQTVFWDFIEGIASRGSDDTESDLARLFEANTNCLQPFLERYPAALENYLLNYVYQHLFPFGRSGSARLLQRTFFQEALLLAAQFTWLTTLLAGVSGKHRDQFASTHFIATVQSFTRAVEHIPQVLEGVLAHVERHGLNTPAGLMQLLKL